MEQIIPEKIKNSCIIGYAFNSGRDCVGFVLVEDVISGKEKAYCGVCAGKHEVGDVLEILQTGQKFPAHIARQYIEYCGVIIKR